MVLVGQISSDGVEVNVGWKGWKRHEWQKRMLGETFLPFVPFLPFPTLFHHTYSWNCQLL